MGIRIEDQGNGQYRIESDYAGPLNTIGTLRKVIAAMEQAGAEAENKAANERATATGA
jgi:outer membrane receptor for ferric coprogen and ferric-rhodotorulic acid